VLGRHRLKATHVNCQNRCKNLNTQVGLHKNFDGCARWVSAWCSPCDQGVAAILAVDWSRIARNEDLPCNNVVGGIGRAIELQGKLARLVGARHLDDYGWHFGWNANAY